jgi:hypothetical protein
MPKVTYMLVFSPMNTPSSALEWYIQQRKGVQINDLEYLIERETLEQAREVKKSLYEFQLMWYCHIAKVEIIEEQGEPRGSR